MLFIVDLAGYCTQHMTTSSAGKRRRDAVYYCPSVQLGNARSARKVKWNRFLDVVVESGLSLTAELAWQIVSHWSMLFFFLQFDDA